MEAHPSQHVSLQRQLELLKLEYEFEKQEFQRDTELVGVDRKIKRGDCWFPASLGRSYYNSLDRFVVEISRDSYSSYDTGRESALSGNSEARAPYDVSDIEHNFEYGRQVCFFSREASGKLQYLSFRAVVSFAEENRMVVELPGEGALARLKEVDFLGVQLYFDDYTYTVMFEALRKVLHAQGNRLAMLRDIFHSATPASWYAESAAELRLPWLNFSQEAAVKDILRAKDVLVVHGPPGTGKTTTLVEAIDVVLRREPQVMVCAQSNTAVDWICIQLAERGIPVLRIGKPARVTEQMLAFTYEHRFESHPDYADLWRIRRTIRQLYAQGRRERGEKFHQKIARLRERADEIELRIRQSLYDNARVVASTLTSSASPLLSGHRFHTLFIDEAAQALEAACWIALQKADRVIFAGDHLQLPPTIKCPEALRGGLGRTLMEQIAEQKPEVVRLLRIQYRMNEKLMRFSSDYFYGGQLQAAPQVKNRSLLYDLDEPLLWIDCSEVPTGNSTTSQNQSITVREQFVGSTFGRINKVEAKLTFNALHSYVERLGKQRLVEEKVDFGIISPYKMQVQYLRSLLRHDDFLRPLKKQITINTIDAFQGQERDVILLSLVRANDEGQIGFLSDLRRMNVAITRAKLKLIILGSAETLCRHKFYKKLFDACKKEKPTFQRDGISNSE